MTNGHSITPALRGAACSSARRLPFDSALVAAIDGVAPGAVRTNVDLKTLSRWRIGGPAAVVVEPRSRDEVSAIMRVMQGRPEPLRIIGGGSNVLFDSEGLDGVLLVIGEHLSEMRIDGTRVWAQAGISVPHLARTVGRQGLAGVVHTVGIPGTLGGLVLMNGGTQRKGVGSHVKRVVAVDAEGKVLEFNREACQFKYRRSRLQQLDVVVVEVELELESGDAVVLLEEMEEIVASRAARFPEDLPNCGSTFLSDPAMYAEVGPPGKAIEEASLKGVSRGDAQISPKHANFFVNNGNASADDILWLIALARNTVRERTGYEMDCEVRFMDRNGEVQPAHTPALERWGKDLIAAAPV